MEAVILNTNEDEEMADIMREEELQHGGRKKQSRRRLLCGILVGEGDVLPTAIGEEEM